MTSEEEAMQDEGAGRLTAYPVWDKTQRLFHWINFLAVLALAAIGTVILYSDTLGIPDDPGMILLKTVHVYVGYVFAVNLAWRIVWAFVGSPSSRWSALLPGGRGYGARLKSFVSYLPSGAAPFYLGHNPLARIVLSVLLLSLCVQAVTGLVLAGTDVYMPPFGGSIREWVAGGTFDPAAVRPYAPDTVDPAAYADMRGFRAPVVEIHGLNFYLLIVLIAIHVGAAVLTELKEGGTVISAMFSGRKVHARRPVDVPTFGEANEATSRKEPRRP